MVRLGLAFALALGAACGQPASRNTTANPPTRFDVPGDSTCPLAVDGTSVAVEDTTNGGALVFITTGDTHAVRQRGVAFVDLHDHPQPSGSKFVNMFKTPSTTVSSDVDRGVRIEFSATKLDDVATLQSELRMHASHLASGSCKMAM